MPRPYILCATPRSGSTLLCDLLKGAGVAGRPCSFYRAEDIGEWAADLGVPGADRPEGEDFDRAYLAAILREGTGGTGVFGMRLMWESLAGLSARLDRLFPGLADDRARLERAFGSVRFLHLSRADKVAQAVSRLMAEQSGLWHRHADGSERERVAPPAPPAYDAAALAAHVARLEADEAAWRDWFARHKIEPVRLRYEDLAADPRATLAAALHAIGRDLALAARAEVRTARLADERSRAWAERFRAERGGG